MPLGIGGDMATALSRSLASPSRRYPMAHTDLSPAETSVPSAHESPLTQTRPAYQSFAILRIGFTVLPVLAGLDKFFHVLVNWNQYLAPSVTHVVPASTFMMVVGVIEIVAGLNVACWPYIGAYIVALWLWGIIANLLLIPGYYDIALRDFGLSLGAVALARLPLSFVPVSSANYAENFDPPLLS